MKKALYLNTKREGYGTDQCSYTLTVKEFIELLKDYPENTPVYFRNDKGYTYGSIKEDNLMYGNLSD